MAIRYSGDVEVRVSFSGGFFHGAVRSAHFVATGTFEPKFFGLPRTLTRKPTSEEYDRIALHFLREARALARRHKIRLPLSETQGRIDLRRTFQAPCPVSFERASDKRKR